MLLDHEGRHFSFGASVEEHLPGQCAGMLRSLHALIKRMLGAPVPILVADRFGTVIDVNPEARAHIGLGVHRVLWRKIDDVLPEIPGQPEHEVWPLVIRGQESGQLVLLDPPAKAETREAEREAS